MNPTPIHPKLAEITERIIERSRPTREKYLAKIRSAKQMGRLERNQLGCSNLAHGYASMPKSIKIEMLQETVPNLGIITAYNDMVSAHQPFKDFPDQIKDEAQKTRYRPSRRRHARHVRRHHARLCRYGIVAVLPRRDCHEYRHRSVAPNVRRQPVYGRVRQNRSGLDDRRFVFRPYSGHLRSGRPNVQRYRQ